MHNYKPCVTWALFIKRFCVLFKRFFSSFFFPSFAGVLIKIGFIYFFYLLLLYLSVCLYFNYFLLIYLPLSFTCDVVAHISFTAELEDFHLST